MSMTPSFVKSVQNSLPGIVYNGIHPFHERLIYEWGAAAAAVALFHTQDVAFFANKQILSGGLNM